MRVISSSTEEEMDENSLQQNGSVVGQIVSQISGQNQNNQQNLNNKDDNSGNVANNTQYSIPGILHYIQHEFNRFELEKSQWDVDRAELQVNSGYTVAMSLLKNCKNRCEFV